MKRLMGQTLEDNVVDSLFFCATLFGCRGNHAPFHLYKQKWKHPTPVRRQLSWTWALLGSVALSEGMGLKFTIE